MKEFLLNNVIGSIQKSFGIYFSLKRYFNLIGFEALIWISAILYITLFSPVDQTHFTLCPIKNLGIDFCPGCGLGYSIVLIFHGQFVESFNTHPLGFFAVIIIIHRIYTLLKTNIINYKKATA